MTILHLRGTSGSGKSTIIRALMDAYPSKHPIFEEGRKQPIGYRLMTPDGSMKDLFVVGHYETPCGGCDTIPSLDKIYELVRDFSASGNVVFEGLLIGPEQRRSTELHNNPERFGVYHTICLDVPLEDCVEGIMERRRAKKGPDAPPVNPKNTTAKHKQVAASGKTLQANGLNVYFLNREDALKKAREVLEIV